MASSMNVEFINPFLSSISNVLATMAMMEPQTGKAAIQFDDLPPAEFTGIIEMNSPQTCGVLAISFTEPLICEITKRMLGDDTETVDETLKDLVGEITNIVCGNAKAILDQKGYDFDMATPRVVKGRDKDATFPKSCTVLVIPFSTEFGEFFVEIGFDKIQNAAAAG